MKFGKNSNGEPTDIAQDGRAITLDNGAQTQPNIWSLWSHAELAAIGYYPINYINKKPDQFHSATYGWAFDGTQFTQTYSETLKDVSAIQMRAQQKINACKQQIIPASETARQVWLSSGDVKQSVYRKKDDELVAYRAAVSPVDSDYPYALDRATRKGVTVADVMNEWEAIIASANVVGIAIESAYETAKDALNILALNENIEESIAPIMQEFNRQMILLSGEQWSDENGTLWEMTGLPSDITITEVIPT